jgi:hypothetical protein
MKKLILLFALLFSVLTTFSQSNNFELFRCSSLNLKQQILTTGQWRDTTYTNLMYLMSYDLESLVYSFDNAFRTKIYISSVMNKSTKKDADNNEYTETMYFCHDQDNMYCHFIVIRYKDLPDVTFSVEYSNMIITIRAKLIKAAIPIPTTKPKQIDGSSEINIG